MTKKARTPKTEPLPRWYRGADVPMRVIRRFARDVAERFQPDKIILFGSYAYGTPHADSDVDILVIMPARNQLDMAVKISVAIDPPFPLDIIVRTPKNMKWRLEVGDWFLREIVLRGKTLYESGGTATFSPSENGHSRRSRALTKEWIDRAEVSYGCAKLARLTQLSCHSQVCFHCCAAAENYLKALLQELGLPVSRTRDLRILQTQLLPYYSLLSRLGRGLVFLTRFDEDILYPPAITTRHEAETALRWDERVRTECRSLLGIKPRRRRTK